MAGPSRRSAGAWSSNQDSGNSPRSIPSTNASDSRRREELLRLGAGRSARPVVEPDGCSGNRSGILIGHVSLLKRIAIAIVLEAPVPRSTRSGGPAPSAFPLRGRQPIVEPCPGEPGEPREPDQGDERAD